MTNEQFNILIETLNQTNNKLDMIIRQTIINHRPDHLKDIQYDFFKTCDLLEHANQRQSKIDDDDNRWDKWDLILDELAKKHSNLIENGAIQDYEEQLFDELILLMSKHEKKLEKTND